MRVAVTFAALVGLLFSLAGCAAKNKNGSTSPPAATPAVADGTGNAPPLPTAQDAAGYVALGNEFYRKDEDERAVEAYRKALEFEADYPEAHLRLGLTYRVLGQEKESEEEYAKAVKAYERATKADAKDAAALRGLAEAYAQTGEYEKSVDAYKRAQKLEEFDADTYYSFGETYTKLARYKEAMAAYQKALDLDPDFYRASEALERAKAGNERVENARKEFEKQQQKQRGNQNANQNANLLPVVRNSNDPPPPGRKPND
ncbi:MAG TPA: tetratricopeptide repeat protein [Pyrinomonadaceae bacterium]|jgi:tetratricopeptide (TPR) repeat protein